MIREVSAVEGVGQSIWTSEILCCSVAAEILAAMLPNTDVSNNDL